MKQALTAPGLLPVWFDSAYATLYQMGFSTEEDQDQQLRGSHETYGNVIIDFIVPVEGKTRMEVAYTDESFYAEFKKVVIGEYYRVKAAFDAAIAESQDESSEPDTSYDAVATTADIEAAPDTDTAEEVAPEPEAVVNVPEEVESQLELPEMVQDATDVESVESSQQMEAEVEPVLGGALDNVESLEKGSKDAIPIQAESFETSAQDETFETPAPVKTSESSVSKPKKKNTVLIAIIVILALAVVAVGGYLGYKYFMSKQSSEVTTTDDTGTSVDTIVSDENLPVAVGSVTLAMYDQIAIGMTYTDVCNLFGTEGNLLSESTYTDADGNAAQLKIYYWEGKSDVSGANATITFQVDKVITKSQYGLQ